MNWCDPVQKQETVSISVWPKVNSTKSIIPIQGRVKYLNPAFKIIPKMFKEVSEILPKSEEANSVGEGDPSSVNNDP